MFSPYLSRTSYRRSNYIISSSTKTDKKHEKEEKSDKTQKAGQ
jgi:hypothetical protein